MNKKINILLLCVLFAALIFFAIPWLRFIAFVLSFDSPFAKRDVMISPMISGYFITLLTVPIAYLLSRGKSEKSKYRAWGVAVMLSSVPFADSLGYSYAIYTENGFAWLSVVIFFPVLFLIGLILLLVGFFKKDANRGDRPGGSKEVRQ